jgi:hypothetical protein
MDDTHKLAAQARYQGVKIAWCQGYMVGWLDEHLDLDADTSDLNEFPKSDDERRPPVAC